MKLCPFLLLLLLSLSAQAQFYAPYNPLNGNGHPRYFGIYNYDSTLAWDVEQMHLVRQAGGYTVFAAEPQFASNGVGGSSVGLGMPWYGDTVTMHPNGRVYYPSASFWVNPDAKVGDTLYCSPAHPIPGTNASIFRVDTIQIETFNGVTDTVKVSYGPYSSRPYSHYLIRLHRTQGWITTPPPYGPIGSQNIRFAEGAPGFPTRYANYNSQEALSFSVGDQAGFIYQISNEAIWTSILDSYVYQHMQRILQIDSVSADSLLIMVQDSSQLIERQVSNLPNLIGPIVIDTLRLGIRPSRFRIFDNQPFDTAGSYMYPYRYSQSPAFAGTTIGNHLGRGRWLDQDGYFESGSKSYYYNGWPFQFGYSQHQPGTGSFGPFYVGTKPHYFSHRSAATGQLFRAGTLPQFITSTASRLTTSALRLSPNPAQGSVRVAPPAPGSGWLYLYDAHGRLCLSQPCQGATQIDRRNLPAGMYQLVLSSAGRIFTARLVWE